jgi:hypothetical protein
MRASASAFAKFAAAALAAASLLSPSFAQQSDGERQLIVKLMQETKIVAVADVTDPAKFVDDKDPETLEVVFLKDAPPGSDRVSDDGEVIFVSDDRFQEALFQKAFEIRAKRRLEQK